jgi:prepilin-type N-terminal cleavage/methylation domain-containing protein
MIARSKKAFTLLELIVVVVVLGILAALAIPSFAKVKETAADKVALNSAQSIYRNAQALAAFDGVAVAASHITDAGAETSVFTNATSKVTVISGGETGEAYVCLTGAQATACN